MRVVHEAVLTAALFGINEIAVLAPRLLEHLSSEITGVIVGLLARQAIRWVHCAWRRALWVVHRCGPGARRPSGAKTSGVSPAAGEEGGGALDPRGGQHP